MLQEIGHLRDSRVHIYAHEIAWPPENEAPMLALAARVADQAYFVLVP